MNSLIGNTPQETADIIKEVIDDDTARGLWERNEGALFKVVSPVDVANSARKEVRKWALALESGEYDQGIQLLKKKVNDHYAYCCLGVLCQLAGVMPDRTVSEATMPYNLRQEGQEPEDLKNIFYEMSEHDYFDVHFSTLLAHLNDSGIDFKQIAELIRYKYKIEKGV